MAQAAWVVCNGESRGTFVAGDTVLARKFIGRAWPFLCGAELLIRRFRTECFQLEEPVDDWGLFGPRRAFEYRWPEGLFGPRRAFEYRWPEHECNAMAAWMAAHEPMTGSWWPHLCTGWEVFATETYDGQATLGLCWVKP